MQPIDKNLYLRRNTHAMIRFLFLASIFIPFNYLSFAQDTSYLKVAVNKGIGLSYDHVYYNYNSDGSRHRATYSAGGGAGIQLEYGRHINDAVSTSAIVGYQQILAVPTEEGNDKFPASFNYIMLGLNLNAIIVKTEGTIQEISIGGGGMMALPGKLRRTEEGAKISPLKFHRTYGWQLISNLMLDPFESDRLKLDTFLGYKNLSYTPRAGNKPKGAGNLNGSGFFLGVGIRTYF